MPWIADKKAVRDMSTLCYSLLVHGVRGAAWADVCQVIGMDVGKSFAWLCRPPKTKSMVKIVQRFKVFRREAMTEAVRRMGTK